MRNAILSLIGAVACIATPAHAQSPESVDLTTVGTDPRWKIVGRTASTIDIKGKRVLKISEGPSGFMRASLSSGQRSVSL